MLLVTYVFCKRKIIVLWSFISFNLKFQSKFPDSIKHDIASWSPAHGIRLECTCTVILNALGYIGFKVCLRSDYVSSQTFKQFRYSYIISKHIIYIFLLIRSSQHLVTKQNTSGRWKEIWTWTRIFRQS